MILEKLHRDLRYHYWANQETLRSLVEPIAPPAKAIARMAHIVGADGLWLDRIEGKTDSIVWPEWPLEEIQTHLHATRTRWERLTAALSDQALGQNVQYKNSKGEPWSSPLADILAHVVMHGAYHRGQIASDLRAAGFEPAYTDFIHAARNRFI